MLLLVAVAYCDVFPLIVLIGPQTMREEEREREEREGGRGGKRKREEKGRRRERGTP